MTTNATNYPTCDCNCDHRPPLSVVLLHDPHAPRASLHAGRIYAYLTATPTPAAIEQEFQVRYGKASHHHPQNNFEILGVATNLIQPTSKHPGYDKRIRTITTETRYASDLRWPGGSVEPEEAT